MKAAPFTHHTKYSDRENLAHRRTLARLWALFKRIFEDGLGKLYTTGCHDLTIYIGLNIIGRLGTGSKEGISGNIIF